MIFGSDVLKKRERRCLGCFKGGGSKECSVTPHNQQSAVLYGDVLVLEGETFYVLRQQIHISWGFLNKKQAVVTFWISRWLSP